MDSETSLYIIDEAEQFICLFNGHHIHEPSRVCGVASHFAIDFDKALRHDHDSRVAGERIVESVPQETRQR